MTNFSDCPAELREQYERDGVIRLRQLFDASTLERVGRELERYIREIGPMLSDADIVREADGESVRNLWRMEHHDAFFRELAADADLRKLLTGFLHGEPELMAVETFNKPAKVGSGVPPHQDNAYFCHQPPDVLTVWIAIDPVTRENGPVYYIRGSHQRGMLPHRPSGVKGNSMGLDAAFDDSAPLVGTLDPGDALIHHCQTIHYSEPNETDQSRRALVMVFKGCEATVDPQLKAQYAEGGAATG